MSGHALRIADCGLRIESKCAVSAILFDAVGTLIAPDPPVAEAYHAAGLRFGSQLRVDEIRLRFRSALAQQESHDSDPAIAHRTSPARELQRWRTIVGDVFDDVSDREGLFQSLWDHFARPEHWRVYDDVSECCRRLAAAGFTLGIASNFDDRLDAICQSHDLLAGCRRFVSSQIGHKKPSLEFFRSIERSLERSPEQMLLVGDDLENDSQAAPRAGWQAILLDRNGELPSEFPVSSALRSLGELPDMLARNTSSEHR